MMRKRYLILTAALVAAMTMTACGGETETQTDSTAQTETADDTADQSDAAETQTDSSQTVAFTTYDDLIDNVQKEINNGWNDKLPEDYGVSVVAQMGSPYFGYCKKDINGDGTDELLLGESPEGSDSIFYNLYTMTSDGKMVSLYNGGERDRLYLVKDHAGLIANEGSNSASDSVLRYFTIEKAALKDADAPSGDVTYDKIEFTAFKNDSSDTSASGSDGEWKECSLDEIKSHLGSAFKLPAGAGSDVYCRWYDPIGMAELTFHIDDVDYTMKAQKASEFIEITDLQYSKYDTEENCQICGKYKGIERRVSEGGTYYDSIQWYDSGAGIMYSITAMASHDFDGFDIQGLAEEISK